MKKSIEQITLQHKGAILAAIDLANAYTSEGQDLATKVNVAFLPLQKRLQDKGVEMTAQVQAQLYEYVATWLEGVQIYYNISKSQLEPQDSPESTLDEAKSKPN